MYAAQTCLPLILNHVEEASFSKLHCAGDFVQPDDIVFAVLIRGLGKQASLPDWTAIARVLSRMQDPFDVQMSTTVYNALLEICVRSNDLQRAEDLLDRMASSELQPDEESERVMQGKRAFRSLLRRTFDD